MTAPCFVYFVQAGESGNIKIGVSRNVASRLSKLQTDAGDKIKPILVAYGDEKTEAAFHSELKDHRVYGEWFKPHPAVHALIERVRSTVGPAEYIPPAVRDGPMTQATSIISKFGGEGVVAEVLQITVPRVRRWSFTEDKGGNDGRIPPKHYHALLEAAKARGIDLAPEDFFESGRRQNHTAPSCESPRPRLPQDGGPK